VDRFAQANLKISRRSRYEQPDRIDYRRPAYPHQVGGPQIYTAVLHDQVRTPAQFAAWLAQPGLPVA